jgi:hypothetical protein
MSGTKSFDLSPKQRELFARLLREKGLDAKQAISAIPPRPDGSPPPLSFSQQRLWYLEKLLSGKATYNIPVAVRLEGSLDVPALHRSLNDIVHRHEVVRATFDLQATQPSQTIQNELTLMLPVEEWPAGQDVNEALTAEAQKPFNLETGPLLRAKLLKLGPESHIFLFTIHHIVADGWSLAVIFRELSTFYQAYVTGKTADLPPVTVQYPDFASWQRQRLSGDLKKDQ